jgi:hypothetical protein
MPRKKAPPKSPEKPERSSGGRAPAKRKAKTPAPKSDPDQYKRFLETAAEVEASADPKAFDRAFGRTVKPPK